MPSPPCRQPTGEEFISKKHRQTPPPKISQAVISRNSGKTVSRQAAALGGCWIEWHFPPRLSRGSLEMIRGFFFGLCFSQSPSPSESQHCSPAGFSEACSSVSPVKAVVAYPQYPTAPPLPGLSWDSQCPVVLVPRAAMRYRTSLRHAAPPGTERSCQQRAGVRAACGTGSLQAGARAARGLSAELGTPAGSPGQPQHCNLCGAEIVRAHLHERAGVEQ